MNNTSNTNQFIESLREKFSKYTSPEQAMSQYNSLVQLSSGIYTEEIRFIYELLQNADDAAINKNMEVRIELDNTTFSFSHKGNAFREVDVKSICSVGDGGKTADKNKTGYKGIGFKSVFTHSKDVTITSGEFCFAFSEAKWKGFWDENWGSQTSWKQERRADGKQEVVMMPWQIMPISREQSVYNRHTGFNVTTLLSDVNVGNLEAGIRELLTNPELLLFLRSENAHVVVVSKGNICYDIKKETTDTSVSLYESSKLISQWFTKKVSIDIPSAVSEQIARDEKTPPKLREATSCELSFAIQVIDGKLVTTKDSLIYSYLPTSESFDFPFVVNSNFILDAGRQGLIKDCLWNQWLFEELPYEYMKWVAELAKAAKFHSSLLAIIPEKHSTSNHLLQKFNKGLERAINEIAFLPNTNGILKKAKEALFDNTTLSTLLPLSMIVDFVNKSGSLKLTNDALLPTLLEHKGKLKSFGVNFFGLDELKGFFRSSSFQEYHKVEDNYNLIEFLFNYVKNQRSQDKKEEWENMLKNTPFIFSANDELLAPKELYYPSTSKVSTDIEEDVVYVSPVLVKLINYDLAINEWLFELGVAEPNEITFIEKSILGNQQYVTKENTIDTFRLIFNQYKKNNLTQDHLDKCKQLKLLTTRSELKSAQDLFMPSRFKPLMDLESVYSADFYLSTEYRTSEDNLDEIKLFLSKIGIKQNIEIECVNLYKSDVNSIPFLNDIIIEVDCKEEYANRGYTYYFNNFEIRRYAFINKISDSEFAKLYWEQVFQLEPEINLWDRVKGESGWWPKSHSLTSFTNGISYQQWYYQYHPIFPSTQKKLHKGSDLFINTKENISLIGEYLPVLDCSIDLTNEWITALSIKQVLTLNDMLQVLSLISSDVKNREENKKRIIAIYNKIANNYLSRAAEIKAWAANNKLLSTDGQFKKASELSYVIASGFEGNHIYSGEEKLSEDLIQLFKSLGVKIIDDIKPNPQGANQTPSLTMSLLQRLPYFIYLYEKKNVVSLAIDTLIKLIEELSCYQCREINLSYESDGETIEGDAVRSFISGNTLYYKSSFDNPATLLSLAPQLTSYLGFDNYVEEFKMLLQMSVSQIVSYFEEMNYYLTTSAHLQAVEKSSMILEKYIKDEEEIEQSLHLTDNSDEKSRISISTETKEVILSELKRKSFIVPDRLQMNYTIVDGVKTPDGKEVKLVLKGGRAGKIYFNPSEWLALSNANAQLFVVTCGGIVRNVSLSDLERINDTFHMRFNTEQFALSNMSAFARFFKYLPYTHFIFNTPESSTDFLSSFGLNDKNSSANDLTADELNLLPS